jgi:hypothetical protein
VRLLVVGRGDELEPRPARATSRFGNDLILVYSAVPGQPQTQFGWHRKRAQSDAEAAIAQR